MNLIFLIFFILFSHSIFANEEDNSEVEVINLYETKSLDQMVLENLNEKEEQGDSRSTEKNCIDRPILCD